MVLEEKTPEVENDLHEASEEMRNLTVERKEGGGGGAVCCRRHRAQRMWEMGFPSIRHSAVNLRSENMDRASTSFSVWERTTAGLER